MVSDKKKKEKKIREGALNCMKVAVKALLQKYSIWIYGVLNFRFIKES